MALTGFDMSLLQQKYAAMTKQADADMKRADAAMLSASRSGLDGGGAMDPNAGLQAQLIQAQIKQAIAATNAMNVQSSNAEDANLMSKKLFDRTYNFDGPTRDQLQADAEADAQLELEARDRAKKGTGYKRGVTKVPGKGSGKVDTKPAMLAPGEAVLNKAAAEHLGRGVIKALNALGRQKMGMV